jgi:DNA-binding transcriptional LysR family regulator
MKMEILQLKYFCRAAETENFSKAAAEYMVPPSDVSQSVKRLEREIGAELFDRNANRIRLNDAGRRFFRRAKTALDELNLAKKEALLSVEQEFRLCLKVNRRIVSKALEKLRLLLPETSLSVLHTGDPKTENFDLVVTSEELPARDFYSEKLFSEPMLLAIAASDPLSGKDAILPTDLEKEPFISMNAGESQYEMTLAVCRGLGFEPRIAVQGDDPYFVRRCVESGLGVAIVPGFSWQGQFSDRVLLKEVSPLRRSTYLCYRKNRSLHPVAKELIRLIREEYEKDSANAVQ